MKNLKLSVLAAALITLSVLAACSDSPAPGDATPPSPQSSGQIYLYGEEHAVDLILDKELELWHEYYHNENMRHLFIELPYYTGEFLNIWMQSDSDDILEAIYRDWAGSLSHNPSIKEFYRRIKDEFPETIFHGTDIGHQYNITGVRYLRYLEENKLKDSEQYLLAQEAVAQGKYYYGGYDDVYRENKMAENFIREFEKLGGKSIMGIYGGGHTGLDTMDYMTRSVPSMANQLKQHYGDAVYSEDLTWLAKEIEPIRADIIIVNEKEYQALYFGKQDLTGFRDYAYREFWRLEDAYEDFKDRPKTGSVLPYDNYLMLIETGQVFVIDYTETDGSIVRTYHRSDGYLWGGAPATEEFQSVD